MLLEVEPKYRRRTDPSSWQHLLVYLSVYLKSSNTETYNSKASKVLFE
jgi:hypothetical protein